MLDTIISKLAAAARAVVAFIQRSPRTGILLTLDGKHANGDEHWYPFESQAAAEKFCTERLRERPESGWAIFNEDRTKSLSEHTDRAYWAARSAPEQRASFWQRLRARLKR